MVEIEVEKDEDEELLAELEELKKEQKLGEEIQDDIRYKIWSGKGLGMQSLSKMACKHQPERAVCVHLAS